MPLLLKFLLAYKLRPHLSSTHVQNRACNLAHRQRLQTRHRHDLADVDGVSDGDLGYGSVCCAHDMRRGSELLEIEAGDWGEEVREEEGRMEDCLG